MICFPRNSFGFLFYVETAYFKKKEQVTWIGLYIHKIKTKIELMKQQFKSENRMFKEKKSTMKECTLMVE